MLNIWIFLSLFYMSYVFPKRIRKRDQSSICILRPKKKMCFPLHYDPLQLLQLKPDWNNILQFKKILE